MEADHPTRTSASDAPPAPARRRTWLALALSLLAGFLLLEGALRFLLFSDLELVRELGWRLRREAEYSLAGSIESWKLRALFSGRRAARAHPQFEPRMGWLKPGIDPATLAHEDEARRGARRPLLFFGDSYAACVTGADTCWQGLLERSELGRDWVLFNYGVGGYGSDQILLLLEQALPRHAEADPLVVVGLLVEDDLDRAALPLRAYPKPYFTLADEELALHPVEQRDAREFLDAHPVEIQSYVWRWILCGSGLFADDTVRALTRPDEPDPVELKKALNRAILARLQAELERRGLDYFFVLFHGRRSLNASGLYGWQEPFLRDLLAERHIPFVSSKRYLLEHLQRTGADSAELFFDDGPGVNHYREPTNAIVFQALADGIGGRFEPADEAR